MTDTMDEGFTEAELEAARKLFAGPCDFVLGVAGLNQLPVENLPEVAFAGRSNVGKSSLINALTGRKGLARTSNTPGRTQQLNFFNLGDRLHIVDLPGYGYAEAPKDIVVAWQDLIRLYLQGRAQLRRAFVLIDSRIGVKAVDHEIMRMLDVAAVSYQVVLTKADKIKTAERPKILAQVEADVKKHPAAHPELLQTSSEKGAGIAELRAVIAALAPAP